MEPNCDSKSRRKCVSEKKYKFVRAIVAALCVMMLALTVVPSATMYAAEDVDDSYDMESVSNTLGTIMSIGSMPVGKADFSETEVTGVTVLKDSNAGNAGLVLAYTSKPTSLGQWLASQVSASSMRYDYEALLNVPINDSGSTTQTVYQYAVYGRALQQLGLDKTVIPAQQSNLIRAIGGGIMLVAYIVAYAVNGLFSVVISILQALNPFMWIEYVAKDYTAELGAQYSTTFGGTGAWHTLMRYIASIYVTMCNLSWALIIPMSLGLYLANMFLFRKTAGGKRLMKRIVFIAIGVPLVGGTYTSFLNEMKTTFSSTSSYADNIVASTFMDFEGWAANTHLAMPSHLDFQVEVPVSEAEGDKDSVVQSSISIGGEVTDKTRYDIKKICAYLNYYASGNSFNSTSTAIEGFTFTNTTTVDVNAPIVDTELSESEMEDALKLGEEFDIADSSPSKKSKYIINMLWRYMYGDVYSAEQYASSIQSRMSALSRSSDTYEKDILVMMKALSRYTNVPSYKDEESLWGKLSSLFVSGSNEVTWHEHVTNGGSEGSENENIAKYATSKSDREAGVFGYTSIFNDGGLNCSVDGKIYDYSSSYVSSPYLKYGSSGAWRTGYGYSGLSTSSMYAYLNNDFTSTGVITYGGGSAITNGLTKANHYSVNIIGTGFMSFIYWFDAVVVMVCIALIGILYAIGMLTGTLKYTVKTIMAMPMAVAGSMRYIAKFVGMVCAMMANVLVTAIMYGIVVEVILAIVNILESSPLILTLAAGLGIYAIVIMSTTMSVVVVIWLTGMLLRIRSSAVNSVTELITQIVGKFFEADGHADPSKPGANIGSKIAGGLAAGAGMAAGAKMAGKAGGMLAGALAGDDAGGGDGGGIGPDGGGSGIEKESQDHFGTDTSSDSQLLGGESTSESETKDASIDRENDSVDLEKSEATNREAQNSEQALIAASNNTHDAKASQSAEHERQQSDSSTHASEESTSAEHDSDEKASKEQANREAQSDKDRSAELSSSKQETSDKQSQAMSQATQVLDKAEQHDSTGTAGLVNDTVKSLDKAGKDLKEGDVKGAVKDTAGAAAGIAVTAATGSTQAGNATSKVVDGAAHGDKGRMAQGAMALAGAPSGANGVAGQMPGGANGGAKQLGGAAPTDAPKKSLGGADSGQKPSTTSNSQGSPNSGQKQASAVDGGKSTSHTASLKAGGMTVNSNITNNISNGGTINTQNVQQGGPSMNMTNSAGNNVNNTTNVTNNNAGGGGHTVQAVGGGNVVNNSAGRNVQNITNVNNVNNVQNMQRGGGNAGAVNGGKNVQNVTNVNNAQTVNNVNTNSSFENRSRK